MGAGPRSEAEVLALAQARVGLVVKDKWRLDALLGLGGMAAVYAATHRNKKRVAVKMLHPQFSGDSEIRQRFVREGYAANVIEHAGAVSVLDDDVTEDGNAFLVMELLQGETLEARWARKGEKLPASEVLAFADQLLDVLAAAHAKGIVHRDIKPENLFLTREGVLKVLDFGIARIFETTLQSKNTRAGEVMGTPAYMAPEQALAKWDQIDGRTDLWAVGATMFTLVTGEMVHPATTGNEQLIFTATRPARQLATVGAVGATLPRSVAMVIDRALAFTREQRWPDAKVMQGAVRAAGASLAAGSAALPSPRVSHVTETEAAIPPESLPSIKVAIDPIAQQAQAMTRVAERDAFVQEVARAQPLLADVTRRLTDARHRTAEVQARVTALQGERAALDQWYKAHVGTRASAADQARGKLNETLAEFGSAVVADSEVFGAEWNPAREEIRALESAAEVVLHDVAVHEAALTSYDEKTYKRGLVVVLVSVTVAVLLFFSPVIIRIINDM